LLSIPWCESASFEADDDIATLVALIEARRTAIMSMDYDFLQLVSRNVHVIAPWRTYAVGDVMSRFGIHPRQWCDYRALTGDPSDNVPGIRGIGPKRAAYVLHRRRVLETARIPDTWWGSRLL